MFILGLLWSHHNLSVSLGLYDFSAATLASILSAVDHQVFICHFQNTIKVYKSHILWLHQCLSKKDTMDWQQNFQGGWDGLWQWDLQQSIQTVDPLM